MEELELTQDEQEQAYQAEYDKAFYGEDAPIKEVADEPSEIEETEADDSEDETDSESAEVSEDDGDSGEPDDSGDSDSVDSDDLPSAPAVEVEPEEEELETIMWKGQEVKVTKEEKTALAQKGFDYTSKTQILAEHKKQFDVLERANISLQELEIFERAKKGDKDALAYMLQSSGVDAVDLLDVESNIDLHKEESKPLISQQVAPLLAEVESNPELLAVMQTAISKLPKAVTNVMQQDPEWFRTVHTEVTNGNFDQVIPKVLLKLSQMSNVDRTFFETNPSAFADLYSEVLSGGGVPQASKPASPVPANKAVIKPNMAEVGVKRNGGVERRDEVKADAFTDDKAYQATLARMRRTIG